MTVRVFEDLISLWLGFYFWVGFVLALAQLGFLMRSAFALFMLIFIFSMLQLNCHEEGSLLGSILGVAQGSESFTRAQLDAIANKLMLSDPNKDRWNPLSVIWKPHHNVLTGNYDINVLFAALESRGKHVVWYDRRKCALSMDLTSSADALTGIILNSPTRKWVGLWRSRHWIALCKIDGIWYNLDSDLANPVAFEHGEEELKSFLNQSLAEGGEVLIVFEGNSSGTTILSEE